MATAELSAPVDPCAPRAALAGSLVRAYLGLWALTLLGAAVVALGAAGAARGLLSLPLRSNQNGSVGRMLELAAHNVPIAAWPLLLSSVRVQGHAGARRCADTLVVACAVANVAPVALALGGYGTALIAFVPQLPLEWAALALGYGSWLAEREQAAGCARRLALLCAIAALSIAAAAVETYGVPQAGGRLVNETGRFSARTDGGSTSPAGTG